MDSRLLTIKKEYSQLGFKDAPADAKSASRLHTLHRLDNNKGYSPKNCAWCLVVEQNRHRRGVKLDEKRAAEIRAKYAEGFTQDQLASQYGVHQTAISSVVIGKTWAVQPPLLPMKKPSTSIITSAQEVA